MARVPLIDAVSRPDLADSIERISGARSGRLINVYKTLLNSPPVASAWLAFNTSVRLESGIDPLLRELIIIRIAIVTGVEYVYRAHVPKYAREAGVSDAQLDGLWDWEKSAAFDDRARAVLAYVDAVTRDVRVADAVFEPLRRYFGDTQLVELTVLAGAYNMQCRVLQALNVDPEPSWDLQGVRWKR